MVQHCYITFVNNVPPKQGTITKQMFNSHGASIIEVEIQKLVDLRVLKPVVWNDSQFSYGQRKTMNIVWYWIKKNEYVPYQHLKMNTFETALRKYMYMCTADLRHAYNQYLLLLNIKNILDWSGETKFFNIQQYQMGIEMGPDCSLSCLNLFMQNWGQMVIYAQGS